MDLQLGDVDDLIETTEEPLKNKEKYFPSFKPKVCEAEWFLDESLCSDEDDIKFNADYFFLKKNYKQALSLYLTLLEAPRYGSNRSLMSEICECISICYKKLGEYEKAKAFCQKSNEAGKSSDQKTASLYVKSGILKDSGDEAESLDSMRRLLLLHPYNHVLWLEYSLLQSEPLRKMLYLLKSRQLLQINSRGAVESFLKTKCLESLNKADEMLTDLQKKVGPEMQNKMRDLLILIKKQESLERSQEDWQAESYRLEILGMSSTDVELLFNSKWNFPLDSVTCAS